MTRLKVTYEIANENHNVEQEENREQYECIVFHNRTRTTRDLVKDWHEENIDTLRSFEFIDEMHVVKID